MCLTITQAHRINTLGIGSWDLYLKEHPSCFLCLAKSEKLWTWWFLRSLQLLNFVFLFYWFYLATIKEPASHRLLFLLSACSAGFLSSVWNIEQITRWPSHSKFQSLLFCWCGGPWLSFSAICTAVITLQDVLLLSQLTDCSWTKCWHQDSTGASRTEHTRNSTSAVLNCLPIGLQILLQCLSACQALLNLFSLMCQHLSQLRWPDSQRMLIFFPRSVDQV